MSSPCVSFQGRNNSRIPCSNAENSTLAAIQLTGDATRSSGVIPGSELTVQNVNVYQNLNKVNHHTDRYDNPNLIVRRGQEFVIGVVFNRPYDPVNDAVQAEFLIGNNPIASQGTLITININGKDSSSTWKCRVVSVNGTETQVGITPAGNCIIGLYSIYIAVVTDNGKYRSSKISCYILFNPWASSDQVYMANEAERNEYVLNDVGIIYNGTFDNIGRRPWNFGQFKFGILDACIFILDFGKMPIQFRADALNVSRKGAAMINSQDDDGVLEGNWSEDFSLGTSPSAWTGSTEILQKYASSGGVPVKFGQCWVFAGVFNTFLRCLGLPARLITNFCSAHDSMGDLTTNIVLEEDGKLNHLLSDTIWNYHCWNETFFTRSDIPAAYSGWQVVDATPQEMSDGYYRCGPVSVAAIKASQLSYPYDANFVYAETNSSVVVYKQDKYGNMETIFTDNNYVGKLILTKGLNSNEPQTITSTYKAHAQDRSTEIGADVLLQLEASQIEDGGDIILTINFKNLSNRSRSITLCLTGKVDYYTGATKTQFSFTTQNVSLQPYQAKQMGFSVPANDYRKIVKGQPIISFIAYGFIEETSLSVVSMATIFLQKPGIVIEVAGTPQVGIEMCFIIEFTNTSGYDLADVTLRMEALDLIPVKVKKYRTIQNGSKIKWIESVIPQMAGTKTLVACLDCAAIRDVHASLEINIAP